MNKHLASLLHLMPFAFETNNFLLDFGFAQYLKDEMDSSNLRGSPLYMVGV